MRGGRRCVPGALLLVAAVASGQVPEDPCLPLTRTAAREVAEQLGLAPDQQAWLEQAVGEGRVRDPEHLEAMPGLGPGLRDELVSAFCWSPPWRGSAQAAVREKQGSSLREARLALGRGPWSGVGRLRSDGEHTTVRGALTAQFRNWVFHAGTLRARRGLGLALVTPGAEPRGHAPVRESRSGWRPTLSTHPAVTRGISLEGGPGPWKVRVAFLRGPGEGGEAPSVWGSGEIEASWRGFRLAGFCLGGTGSPALGMRLGGRVGPGVWLLEWARANGGGAQGASWQIAEGSLRLGLSLLRLGGEYRIENLPWYRVERESDRTSFRGEGRWSPGVGRFLRLAWDTGRAVRAGDPWPEERSWLEVEVGDRVLPRVALRLLWRRQSGIPFGEEGDGRRPNRLLRAELGYHGRRWQCALDLRELEDEGGRAQLTAVRVGRGGQWRWELRAALVRREAGAPVLWWYRRRAGGLYGWDAVGTGTWAGGWAAWQRGRLRFEASLDRRGATWDITFALGWWLPPKPASTLLDRGRPGA
jgi:hypothetical protein